MLRFHGTRELAGPTQKLLLRDTSAPEAGVRAPEDISSVAKVSAIRNKISTVVFSPQKNLRTVTGGTQAVPKARFQLSIDVPASSPKSRETMEKDLAFSP